MARSQLPAQCLRAPSQHAKLAESVVIFGRVSHSDAYHRVETESRILLEHTYCYGALAKLQELSIVHNIYLPFFWLPSIASGL